MFKLDSSILFFDRGNFRTQFSRFVFSFIADKAKLACAKSPFGHSRDKHGLTAFAPLTRLKYIQITITTRERFFCAVIFLRLLS
jgi:hypothetical protein